MQFLRTAISMLAQKAGLPSGQNEKLPIGSQAESINQRAPISDEVRLIDTSNRLAVVRNARRLLSARPEYYRQSQQVPQSVIALVFNSLQTEELQLQVEIDAQMISMQNKSPQSKSA